MSEYKKYEKRELIHELGKLLQLSDDEVAELHQQWLNTTEENRRLYSENQELYESEFSKIKKTLTEAGLSFVKTRGLKQTEAKWFADNIRIPLFNRIVGNMPRVPMIQTDNLIQVHEKAKRQHEAGIRSSQKYDKLLAMSYKKAIEIGLSVEDKSVEQIVSEVREYESAKFEAENYPEGTEIEISCCSECSAYFKGERRCSCGHRRIMCRIEGDIVDGFYVETEAD